MSVGTDLHNFQPEYWSYMARVVERHISKKWKTGLAEQLPRGVLADLKRLIYLALKGSETIPRAPTDNWLECFNTYHAVKSIAFDIRLGTEVQEYPIIYFLKKLENLLVVLEHSQVPTVIIFGDILKFFEIFFKKLGRLGEEAREKRRMGGLDE